MRGREAAAGAVLLAFGLFALLQARGLRFGSIAAPGPGFFPLCLATALSLVSLAILVSALRAPPAVPGAASGATVAGHAKVIGTLGALAIYALVLESVGFLSATFSLLVFFFTVLQRQRWFVAVGSALLTSIVTYVVFKMWLGVNLPPGPFRF